MASGFATVGWIRNGKVTAPVPDATASISVGGSDEAVTRATTRTARLPFGIRGLTVAPTLTSDPWSNVFAISVDVLRASRALRRARRRLELTVSEENPIYAPSQRLVAGERERVPMTGPHGTLKRLLEIQAFGSREGCKLKSDRIKVACRAAMDLVQAWPSDVPEPEADLTDDGAITIEQYAPSGELVSAVEFNATDRAAFVLMKDADILEHGYVSLSDYSQILRIVDHVRESVV